MEGQDVDQKMQIFTQNGKFYRKNLKQFFLSVTEVIELTKKKNHLLLSSCVTEIVYKYFLYLISSSVA